MEISNNGLNKEISNEKTPKQKRPMSDNEEKNFGDKPTNSLSQKHQQIAHKRNVADENKLKNIERENELLKKEILKLKTDNKRLRKERSEALEIKKMLNSLQSLVTGLSTFSHHPQIVSPLSPTIPSSILNLPSTSASVSYNISPQTPAPFGHQTNEETIVEGIPTSSSPQLRFDGTEANVVRLVENRPIFILKSTKDCLIEYSKTPTSTARSALKAIFTSEALLSCSVKGNIAKGPLGKPNVKRQALLPDAISAIIEFCKKLAEKNGWNPILEKKLVSAMGTKLSEMRAATAKK